MKTPRRRPAQPSAPAVRVMYIHPQIPSRLYSTKEYPEEATVLVIDLSRKEEVVEVMARAAMKHAGMFQWASENGAIRDLYTDACRNELTALQQHATAKRKKR